MLPATLQQLPYLTLKDYNEIVSLTSLGPVLRKTTLKGKAVEVEVQRTVQPIGQLAMRRRAEEIAECNGQNGAPLYITIGINVYDITGTYFFLYKKTRL